MKWNVTLFNGRCTLDTAEFDDQKEALKWAVDREEPIYNIAMERKNEAGELIRYLMPVMDKVISCEVAYMNWMRITDIDKFCEEYTL